MHQVHERIAGRYEVRKLCGGGMGIVYLCYDTDRRLPVAIKTIRPDLVHIAALRRRFVQEAHVWVKLDLHPNIVAARSVDLVQGHPYLILECITAFGGHDASLESRLSRRRFSSAEALTVALHVCWGMIHARLRVPGLVHRDLKPANVLLTEEGTAKVTDFGLVQAFNHAGPNAVTTAPEYKQVSQFTQVGGILGSYRYMPPEQWRADDLDLRCDIYALGCILYEILAGRPAFDGQTPAECEAAHSLRSPAVLVGVPRFIADIVNCCLEKKAVNRYSTWEQLAESLCDSHERLTAARPQPPSPANVADENLIDKGLSLLNLGCPREALACYEDEVRFARNRVFWNNKGNVLENLGQKPEAIACYERSIALAPDYAFPWNNLGIIYAEERKFDKAIECYDRALAILPEYPDALANRGLDLISLGRFQEGLEWCERALELDPRHVPALNGKGNAFDSLNRDSEALSIRDFVLKIDPWQPLHWHGKASLLAKLERYDSALECLERALEVDSRCAPAWALRSLVLSRLGRASEAQSSLAQAVEIDGSMGVAALFGHEGVQANLSKMPETSQDWYVRGWTLTCLGRSEEAFDCYKKTIARGGEHAGSAAIAAANHSKRIGKIDDALAYCSIALAENPDSVEALVEKGALLCDFKRRPEEAGALFERALTLDPQHVHAWHNRGVSLGALNAWEQALPCFERALQLDPHHPGAWFNKGAALARQGGEEGLQIAVRCFDQAASLGMAGAADLAAQCRAALGRNKRLR